MENASAGATGITFVSKDLFNNKAKYPGNCYLSGSRQIRSLVKTKLWKLIIEQEIKFG